VPAKDNLGIWLSSFPVMWRCRAVRCALGVTSLVTRHARTLQTSQAPLGLTRHWPPRLGQATLAPLSGNYLSNCFSSNHRNCTQLSGPLSTHAYAKNIHLQSPSRWLPRAKATLPRGRGKPPRAQSKPAGAPRRQPPAQRKQPQCQRLRPPPPHPCRSPCCAAERTGR